MPVSCQVIMSSGMQQQQHVLAAVHTHVQQKMDASMWGERLRLHISASLEHASSLGESL